MGALTHSREARVAALTLKDVQSMQDDEEMGNLVFDLLQLFDANGPLQKEAVMRWKSRHGLKAEPIKNTFELALSNGWILEDPTGIYLTHEGQKTRDGYGARGRLLIRFDLSQRCFP